MVELQFNIPEPTIIMARIQTEEQNGDRSFDNHICKNTEDVENSYLRSRFKEEYQGGREVPRYIKVEYTKSVSDA